MKETYYARNPLCKPKTQFKTSLCKKALWATICHLRIQRESRLYRRVVKTKELIVRITKSDVKAEMEARSNLKNTILNEVMFINWRMLKPGLNGCELRFCY